LTGTPTTADAGTVSFASLPTNLGTGQYDAIVVAGRGLGQHRKIIAQSGNTLTLDTPWLLAPDSTSTVIIATVAENVAIYNNTLDGKSDYATRVTASAGIEPYGNSYGFVADSNTFHELRTGISNWAIDSNNSINPSYFNLFSNNRIDSTLLGCRSIAAYAQTQTTNPGVSYLGNVFRTNTFSSTPTSFIIDGSGAPPGKQIMMTIFDHNVGAGLPITFLYTKPSYLDTYFNNLEYKTVLE
jgi:hypothetical protein